ncbi:hypothetical protein GCM10023339_76890 [Alloalcanivorax gelatiniphagus]
MRTPVPSVLVAGLVLLALAPAQPGSAAAQPARVTVIQAVPGVAVDVSVDGRSVAEDTAVGDVLGPFEMAPGTHDISFSGDGLDVESTLDVTAGAASDVVLHLPAEVGGEPLVHSYAAPDGPIGPGKARVLLAHTATVAPADVRVDGQTVFTNIANGEYADADVPEGSIEVALVPSGSTADPILGPLDVSLEAGTLSMIYAYGNPRDASMNVIAHTAQLAPDGSVQPTRIDTGSAGLVSEPVGTFTGGAGGNETWILPGVLGALVAAGAAGALGLRRRTPAGRHRPAG